VSIMLQTLADRSAGEHTAPVTTNGASKVDLHGPATTPFMAIENTRSASAVL
jgi:hypothetical protein